MPSNFLRKKVLLTKKTKNSVIYIINKLNA